MRPLTAALAALAAAACSPLPDTVGEAAPSRTTWVLTDINDAPATYPASLRLLKEGGVRGAGPCNPFTAEQRAPLPWVEFAAFDTEGRICPRMADENAFFIALASMEFAEVAGDSLLLTNTAGQSLHFRAAGRPADQPG